MLSVFWKSLFISFCTIIIMVNIVFAFDLTTFMNPSAMNLIDNGDYYHNYYFGMSSFIDAWESFFGSEDTFLAQFRDWLMNVANKFSTLFNGQNPLMNVLNISKASQAQNMIASIITIALIFISGAPMILLVAYGVLWIAYIVFFAIEVVLFLIAFFGGAFRTELPSTDWYEYNGDWPWIENTIQSVKALMV